MLRIPSYYQDRRRAFPVDDLFSCFSVNKSTFHCHCHQVSMAGSVTFSLCRCHRVTVPDDVFLLASHPLNVSRTTFTHDYHWSILGSIHTSLSIDIGGVSCSSNWTIKRQTNEADETIEALISDICCIAMSWHGYCRQSPTYSVFFSEVAGEKCR